MGVDVSCLYFVCCCCWSVVMSGIYLCVVFDYLFVMLFDYCCDV